MQICKICNQSFQSFCLLSHHIKKIHHLTSKQYYDLYISTTNIHVCLECGKLVQFGRLNYGYHTFCSIKCSNKNKDKLKKQQKTCLQHYGVQHSSQCIQVRQKMQETCLKIFGYKSASMSPQIKQKKKQTFLKKYGVETYTQTQEYNIKRRQTCLQKYGVNDLNQSELVKEKQRNTCLQHYGVDNYTKTEQFKIRQKQTCLQKYGKEFYSQTQEYNIRRKLTCLQKYGVQNPMYVPQIRKKVFKKYKINNIYYDSMWEYLYEQYLIQHNILYKYHPNIFFQYIFNNKKYRYYSDFIILNQNNEIIDIIEIKGDHLYKKMLIENTKEYEKLLCMQKNNIHILMKKELKNLNIL